MHGAQVEKSEQAAQVDRLRRFLSFVGLEAAAGRGGDLEEYVIGVQVFGKEASFDPRTDPPWSGYKPAGCVRVGLTSVTTERARTAIERSRSTARPPCRG